MARHSWTAEEVTLLGTMTDMAVASHVGVTVTAAERARSKRGIPAFTTRCRHRHLTCQEILMLGTAPDAKLAVQFGVGKDAVRRARVAANICPYKKQHKWSMEREAMLGTVADADLAEVLGVSVKSVASARKRRGIPPRGHHESCEVCGNRMAGGHRSNAKTCSKHCHATYIKRKKKRAYQGNRDRAISLALHSKRVNQMRRRDFQFHRLQFQLQEKLSQCQTQ